MMPYENLSMQYTEIFSALKIQNIMGKVLMFLFVLLKTSIVGTRFNEYPQSMFWIKDKKKNCRSISLYTPFLLYKSGV